MGSKIDKILVWALALVALLAAMGVLYVMWPFFVVCALIALIVYFRSRMKRGYSTS